MSAAELELREVDPSGSPRAEHLDASRFIETGHPAVAGFVERATAGASSEAEVLRRLFVAVRDTIRYDPYSVSLDPRDYAASAILERGAAWCVPKAVVLAAGARTLGIPARLGFSDVRNHLQSERLAAVMGSDVFAFHGYAELYVQGAWRKASPAFNAELCERFGVPPLDFDGTSDALLHAYTGDGRRHMEYIRERGAYVDLPLQEILQTFAEVYPQMQVASGADDPAFQ